MDVLRALGHAGELAFGMTWEITWALVLGFTLSAIVAGAGAPRDDPPAAG